MGLRQIVWIKYITIITMKESTLQILVFFTTCFYLTAANSEVKIQNTHYVKEDLATIRGIPADMSIDWHTGDIFFTLISTDSKMTLQVLTKNKTIPQKVIIEGNGQCSAIDNTNHIVYLAADNGIYVYNENKPSQKFAALSDDIMYLAVSNDGNTIYYTTWPEKIVLKINKDRRVPETIDNVSKGQSLTIDFNDNLYYVDNKTPYVLLKDKHNADPLVGFKFSKQFNFYLQKSGDIFICDEDGNLFRIKLWNKEIIKIGNIGLTEVNTFAFDEDDNIVIGVQNKIVLLRKIA